MYNEHYRRIVLLDLMMVFEVDEMEHWEEKCTRIINSYENCMRVFPYIKCNGAYNG